MRLRRHFGTVFTLSLACLSASCLSARAESFTFSLTPTTPNGVAGTGSFTITGDVPTGPGTTNYFYYGATLPTMQSTLTQLTFSIGGLTYNAGDDTGIPRVSFTDGALTSISYIAGIPSGNVAYALLTNNLGYTFGEDEPVAPVTNGTITSVAPTGNAAIMPEPSSLALFGTGLLGVLGMARRRFA